MRAARDSWVNPALALCALTGALFAWLKIPLPWMTGPLLAAWFLNRLRMPNAFFFAPLAMTIMLALNGVQLSSLPTTLSNPAQMLLGCALGARFEGRSLESVPRYVSAVLISVFVAMLVSAGFGWAIGRLAAARRALGDRGTCGSRAAADRDHRGRLSRPPVPSRHGYTIAKSLSNLYFSPFERGRAPVSATTPMLEFMLE